jgi:acyl-coenzyme A synthetase/AMP-(fatty) acid ligase
MKATHPLISGFGPLDTMGWTRGSAVSAAQFCAAALELARTLPKRRFVINLCDNRFNFILAFGAALIARQVSLLPQSRAVATLRDLHASHPDCYCVADDGGLPVGLPAIMIPPWRSIQSRAEVPAIASDQMAMIAFTSGSTGRAQAHSRTWGSLVIAAELLNRRLNLAPRGECSILGTVPPQHVYGFETTVMFPLQSGVPVHAGRPLLPADVAAALNEIPGERWLATTPAHLRTLLATKTPLPRLAGILSATMPLSPELAAAAERAWSATIHEIYGCTETGVVALRNPTRSASWRVNEGIRLSQKGDETWVQGGQLGRATKLPDRIALSSDTEFTLLGRPEDMVKIAGKRASLEALNQELLGVRGVCDGAFFVPEPSPALKERLAAVVVAPGLNATDILRALRERVDSAFLPRPLLIVDALPRNATGKLPRAALLALAKAAKTRGRRSA